MTEGSPYSEQFSTEEVISASVSSRPTCIQSNQSEQKQDSKIESKHFSIANVVYYYESELVHKLFQNSSSMVFDPQVAYIYNPIYYAMDVHLNFLNMFCKDSKKLLFLGMNPGPWGMMQTGVPFGEVNIVRDWLKLNGKINSPDYQHPARPVTGFNCHRSEISGKRFWEFVKKISNDNPFNFSRHSFIYNYLPLGLVSNTGKNITPADFKASDQKSIHLACDEALYKIVRILHVEVILAIGRFSEKRARAVLKNYGISNNIKVIFISHPSPRNVGSNKNWVENTISILSENNLLHYFSGS